MTAQDILEIITGNRANRLRVNQPSDTPITVDLIRKLDEIEWALQAITEKLVDQEQMFDVSKLIANGPVEKKE